MAAPGAAPRLALALAALLAPAGCIYFVEDPDGWQVDPNAGNGAVATFGVGSAGSSGAAGNSGLVVLDCSQEELSCRCSPSTSGGSPTRCNQETLSDSRCCADLQYPQKDTECSCRQLSCKQSTDSCDCTNIYSSGPTSSCEPRAGERCCATESSCSCNASNLESDCPGGARVTRCTASALTCGSQVALQACSN